jgi:hypothetical protein
MVETTFSAINSVRDSVNKAFESDNGTKFLSMAYEEVLYPVAFTAKKKYFGIAHENIPNFNPKDLFIRGLEVKKRGVSDLLKKIFMEIMWLTCNPENLYDLLELVIIKINEIYTRKWTASDFVQTGVYRPPKAGKPGNVKINTFVHRMKEKGIEVKPNERFNYVIVKRYPYKYDTRGRKENISIGDKIEFDYISVRDGLEVDLDYYMQGSVNGQLARLITYHDMFHVEALENNTEEQKIAETKIYKNACKYVDEYCKKFYSSYNTFGKTYQKIFKTANKVVENALSATDPLASDLLCANVNYDDFEEWFIEYTAKKADKSVGEYGANFITAELDRLSSAIKSKYKVATEESDSENDESNDNDESENDDAEDKKRKRLKKYKANCGYGPSKVIYVDAADESIMWYEDKPDEEEAEEENSGEEKSKEEKVPVDTKPVKTAVEIRQEIKERRAEKLKDLQKCYYGNGRKSILDLKENAYRETMSILRKRLRENFEEFMKLYKVCNNGVESIINAIKEKVNIDNTLYQPAKENSDYKLEDFDFEMTDELEDQLSEKAKHNAKFIIDTPKIHNILDKLKLLYNDLLSAHISVKKARVIVDYLKLRRDRENRAVVRPDEAVIKQMIANSKRDEEQIDALNI